MGRSGCGRRTGSCSPSPASPGSSALVEGRATRSAVNVTVGGSVRARLPLSRSRLLCQVSCAGCAARGGGATARGGNEVKRGLRRALFGAVLAATSVAAASCGGGDGDGVTSGTIDEGVRAGVDEQLGGNTTGSGAAAPATEAKTMADLEEIWAAERAAVVEKIKANGWGIDAAGTTVTGPEGFTIDLSKCPAGWSNTEGLTDTEIKIGHTTAQSGTLADSGNIGKVMSVLFEDPDTVYADATGKTRRVNFIVSDDGYDPARTIPLVDELIDSERVFAAVTHGSPSIMKTYDKLNQRCIPQPVSQSGHPAWGDPVNHPWTTGAMMAYNTEAVLWGAFVEGRLEELSADDGKVTVASLVMNNDFGKSYDGGFRAFLAQFPGRDKIEYVTETIEPSAPTVKDPMTTLASQGPEVFIAMTAGISCTQTITEVAENGMKEAVEYLFMPSTCKASSTVGKEKVGGDGSASGGWWIIGGGQKDIASPHFDDDPYISWARDLLTDKGIDYKSSGQFGLGFFHAWATDQALRIASQLDGGLTRVNLIVALRSMDMTHPMLLPGIKFNMNGNADPYYVEGTDISRYDHTKQAWVQEGAIIELSGQSDPCVWDQAAGSCT
ncbi:MAG: ABC transporter substrate-binding protein [Acidimicrobiia bacterium]|nr:ABC transporter substrate-binding protein [Acidimicrobiia bacterium]